MSIRLDVGTDYLQRTTNLPPDTDFTIMGWFKISVDTNTWATFIRLGSATSANYVLGTTEDGTTLNVFDSASDAPGSSLTVGTWYHLALTLAADNLYGYVNGALDMTNFDSPGLTETRIEIGNASEAGEFLNGCVEAVKIWNIALTNTEILAEMASYGAVKTANFNSAHPFRTHTELTDLASVNTFTAGGTLTTEAGPGGFTDGGGAALAVTIDEGRYGRSVF